MTAALSRGAAAPSDDVRIEQVTLQSRVFSNTRQLRVLLPPGYDRQDHVAVRYPVFYFLDGIAAFDAWGVPAAARELWSGHVIPPMLFVGIDNGGSTLESNDPVRDRASEYLPYPDQSWITSDAPRPRGESLPSFLFDEVMPLINARFRTKTDPQATGLAGDSFAGAAALYVAMKHPARFGLLLIESPSLHIGEGRLLSEATRAGAWPRMVYLGVGTQEGDTPAIQAEMLRNVRTLYSSLEPRPAVRVHLEVTAGATHGYSAWGQRLPAALRWLLGPPNSEMQWPKPAQGVKGGVGWTFRGGD
jgi:enterochelin esterase-like enzyme